MPKTEAELPRRSICKYRDHAGTRWLPWIYFDLKWVYDKRSGKYYVYLQSYCKTCVNYASRERRGITGAKIPKLYTEQERVDHRRKSHRRSYRRKMNDPKLRASYNENRRITRKAKQEYEEESRR